jgi:hypothetical protein
MSTIAGTGHATFRSLLRNLVDQADRQREPLRITPRFMNTYPKAWAKCEAKALIAPTKAKATWNEDLVVRLCSLAARFPSDDDLADAMGLSVSQVQRARRCSVEKRSDAAATLNAQARRLS